MRLEQWRGATLVDVLRHHTAVAPHDVGYIMTSGGDDDVAIDYATLLGMAERFGAMLAERDLAGKPLALLLPTSIDWLVAFFGIIMTGGSAVPVGTPTTPRALDRLRVVLDDARVAGCVIAAPDAARMRSFADRPLEETLGSLIAPEAAGSSSGAFGGYADTAAAIIQYTSGSTSVPKGVIVSHRNFVANAAMIARALGVTADDRSVSWLPLFHDMGLMTGIVLPLLAGRPSALMAPTTFLARPHLWLRAMTRLGGTMTAAPDFGYALCVDRIVGSKCDGLDLRAWRVAVSGAEPVRQRTLDRFGTHFARFGFSTAAFVPCYGLAEATLFVSGGPAGMGARQLAVDRVLLETTGTVAPPAAADHARSVMSCGRIAADIGVAIVDAAGLRLPDRRIGEIWITGESVACGYVDAVASAASFGARLAGEDQAFCRTGDIGFVADGELFITGRVKDMMIVNGVNHYPQDFEETSAGSHPAVAGLVAVAFSGTTDAKVHIVQEVRPAEREHLAIARAIVHAVFEGHGVSPASVSLVRAGTIPRTTSGKTQRLATQAALGALEMVPVFRWPAIITD